MTRSQDEYRFHMDCVRWLAAFAPEDVLWFHVPNGEKRDVITGAKLKRMGVVAGVSDLIVVRRGLSLFVEIKAEGGRQSESQRAFEQRVLEAGAAYVLVRNLREFELAMLTFFYDGGNA